MRPSPIFPVIFPAIFPATLLATLLVACGPSASDRDLFDAANAGDLAAVERALDHGAEVRRFDDTDALTAAAGRDHAAIVRRLLEVTTDDAIRANAMVTAAGLGSTQSFEALSAAGVPVDRTSYSGVTPLVLAAYAGQHAMIDRLLAAGADPNQPNTDGEVPLLVCSVSPEAARVARRLLDAGARPNVADAQGKTAVEAHAQLGRLDALRMIVDAGGDVRHAEDNGQTALHYAAMHGHLDVTRFLLEHHADASARSSLGGTPLVVAVEGAREPEPGSDHAGVVALLLAHGADASARRPDGYTAFGSAAALGLSAILERMIDAGVDPNADGVGDFGSALAEAAAGGHDHAVQVLVSRGADVNRASAGFTPLTVAASTSQPTTLRVLLSVGADPNIATDTGASALHMAAYTGDLDAVQALVDAHADIHRTNPQGGCAARRMRDTSRSCGT